MRDVYAWIDPWAEIDRSDAEMAQPMASSGDEAYFHGDYAAELVDALSRPTGWRPPKPRGRRSRWRRMLDWMDE